jgi:hypothetical protein
MGYIQERGKIQDNYSKILNFIHILSGKCFFEFRSDFFQLFFDFDKNQKQKTKIKTNKSPF